jgi:pyrroline-5-carboxylate reductase
METSPSPAALPHKIGFIGGGQMALALAKGFMASGLISPSQILTSAPSDTNLMIWRQLNAETTHVNADVVKKCDIVFFAVKPHIFPFVMRNLRDSCDSMEELVFLFKSAFLLRKS